MGQACGLGWRGRNACLNDQNAARCLVGYAVGRVAQQPSPEGGVVAVANHDEIVAALLGGIHDGLGGMAAGRIARDRDAMFSRERGDFRLALSEVAVCGLGFLLDLSGKIRMARQRLP